MKKEIKVRRILLVSCILVLTLGAVLSMSCGNNGSPKDVVKRFYEAINEGDFSTYKSLMIESDRKEIERRSFDAEEDFDTMVNLAPFEYEIVKEDIQGDKARVELLMKVSSGEDEPGEIELIKENGEWKIDYYLYK